MIPSPPRQRRLLRLEGEWRDAPPSSSRWTRCAPTPWPAGQRKKKPRPLAAKAATLAAQAQKDGNLAGIAKELKVPVQHSPALARNTNDTTFSAALIAKLFDAAARRRRGSAAGHRRQLHHRPRHRHRPSAATRRTAAFAASAEADYPSRRRRISPSLWPMRRGAQGVKVNQKLLQQATGGAS